MKKALFILSAIVLMASFTSCGVSGALILNANQNTTQVTLSSNNYKIVDRVTGSSEVKYICLIGGMNHKQLYANAYSDMMTKANLTGGSKAIVNVVSEEHAWFCTPFYIKRTVTVSANVIEFTK